MPYFNYADVRSFLLDEDLVRLLCADQEREVLLNRFAQDDFLVIDHSAKIPFFAEVRDYVGAVERESRMEKWIVKPLREDGVLAASAGAVCYFLDFWARTISAPTIVTRIEGTLHKATKVVTRAEQLTGANYTDIPQLKEQLVLDLVNRWIYFDEDRNPNNYLIRYSSRGDQIVIAIDYSNVDLLAKDMKIKGTADAFGWERTEKTRYLTPLKLEHFQGYDMEFFNMRLDGFTSMERKALEDLCGTCLRFLADHAQLAKDAAENVLRRIEYVRGYFASRFPSRAEQAKDDKYADMGKTFRTIYGRRGK